MKKIISIALALLMVAVMLPVMAMADETTTLQDQINAANEGDTIKLDKDYTEDIVINKKLTIDLNNHNPSLRTSILASFIRRFRMIRPLFTASCWWQVI